LTSTQIKNLLSPAGTPSAKDSMNFPGFAASKSGEAEEMGYSFLSENK
jgi:hypothetical protein